MAPNTHTGRGHHDPDEQGQQDQRAQQRAQRAAADRDVPLRRAESGTPPRPRHHTFPKRRSRCWKSATARNRSRAPKSGHRVGVTQSSV